MNKYKSVATYKRMNPKTLVVEETSRFVEGHYTNRTACETELMRQVKHDEPVGKVSIVTKKVR